MGLHEVLKTGAKRLHMVWISKVHRSNSLFDNSKATGGENDGDHPHFRGICSIRVATSGAGCDALKDHGIAKQRKCDVKNGQTRHGTNCIEIGLGEFLL
jgi:hypothetical protein